MKSSYRRWSSLHDRHQSGATLSVSELAELEQLSNEDACSEHELIVRQQLSQLACELQGSDEGVVERALAEVNARDKVVPIRRQLESAGGTRALPGASERRRWLRPALALGGLSTVGMLALLLALRGESQPAAGAAGGVSSLPEPRAVELTFTSGRVLVNGVPTVVSTDALEPNSSISVQQGRACLAMDAQTDLCIDAQSTVVLDDQQGLERSVRLVEGRVAAVLDKRPAPQRFSILSGSLKATALGTAYSVERDAAGVTTVTVMQGRVEVAVSERGARVLRAHEQLELTRGVLSDAQRTTRAEELRHWSLVEPRKLWKQPSVGILHIATEPGSATLSLDGTPLGQAPLSLVAASGPHELALELEEHVAEQRKLTLNPGQEKRVDVPLQRKSRAEVDPAPGSARAPVPARLPSAQELLERARELVRRGQWQSAVSAYRRLRQSYPKSPESHTVLVALGQLELDRLGQPRAALSSFNAYLRSEGGLSQEARFGRIRALRALGQTSGETQAIRDYLRQYPGSADARALRTRLSQLELE